MTKFLNISTDNTLGGATPSDDVVSSQKAIKEYIDEGVFANKSLSNLTDVGKNIGNWSTNISNCITEIPQDIKLEFNNGTLTLKAGSKVYFPNGTDVFDEYIVPSDIVMSSIETVGTSRFIFMIQSNKTLRGYQPVNTVSGDTDPKSGTTYHTWYDTANNLVKCYNASSSTPDYNLSLPIALVSCDNGTILSLDQVFNGFGYIGSALFALPGVKGLTPNGRNTDGTLKNKEFTISSVMVNSSPGAGNRVIILNPADVILGRTRNCVYTSNTKPTMVGTAQQQYWVNPAENIIYKTMDGGTTWTPSDTIILGSYNLDTMIDSFETKGAFQALDYTDVKSYITKTYVNGLSWYRIYSDGWCEQGGFSPGDNWRTVDFLQAFANTNYSVQLTGASTSRGGSQVAHISSDATKKTTSNMYISGYSLNTTNGGIYWRVSGYIW